MMTELESSTQSSHGVGHLPPWMNVVCRADDEEIVWINQLEAGAAPIPPVGRAIRELITRLEICHFKIARHLQRIIEAIGTMQLDLDPATIGRAHPRAGDEAWRSDRTGRSRIGQEYIWILQSWLRDEPYQEDDPRHTSRSRFIAVHFALGRRDPQKDRLVTALIDRLVLKADRPQLSAEFEEFREQIERTDICHYAFPDNLVRMVLAIGRLQPLPAAGFAGCGSCGEVQGRIARHYFGQLMAWLRDGPSLLSDYLGDKTPVKAWLVASLAKTLKEHAGLTAIMPCPPAVPSTDFVTDQCHHRSLTLDCGEPSP